MKRGILVPAAIVILMSLACPKKDTGRVQPNENAVLRLSVYQSGEIRADDKVVSLQDLDGLLEANAKKNGVVWYYCEAGTEKSPPQAIQALTLVIEHRRPLRMSMKPDFSVVTDANEDFVPRKK